MFYKYVPKEARLSQRMAEADLNRSAQRVSRQQMTVVALLTAEGERNRPRIKDWARRWP